MLLTGTNENTRRDKKRQRPNQQTRIFVHRGRKRIVVTFDVQIKRGFRQPVLSAENDILDLGILRMKLYYIIIYAKYSVEYHNHR